MQLGHMPHDGKPQAGPTSPAAAIGLRAPEHEVRWCSGTPAPWSATATVPGSLTESRTVPPGGLWSMAFCSTMRMAWYKGPRGRERAPGGARPRRQIHAPLRRQRVREVRRRPGQRHEVHRHAGPAGLGGVDPGEGRELVHDALERGEVGPASASAVRRSRICSACVTSTTSGVRVWRAASAVELRCAA